MLAVAALALPAVASATVTHTVRRGETLTSVAAQDGLSIAELAAANGLSTGAELVAGAELVIPARGAALPAQATPAPVTEATESAGTSETSAPSGSASAGGFVVPRGDTLTGIAEQFGTTPAVLAAANGMSVNGVLLAGARLTIPGEGTAPAAAAVPSAAPVTGAAPAAGFVSAAEVGQIAAADGVPPALAEAVADQESGFNDAEVSATGAVGVMQIEPATWQDLSRLDGLRLDPASATDNVRGGVAVLRSLLLATGENQAEAIAGYYQGLQSVRAHGMFAGTRHYVADVLALESRF